jgi:hypothetical protein
MSKQLNAKDARRLKRMLETAAKLIDQIDDMTMRGIIAGDWRGATGARLRDDLAEFHDWQLRRLPDTEARA